jgi:hypothetical protein
MAALDPKEAGSRGASRAGDVSAGPEAAPVRGVSVTPTHGAVPSPLKAIRAKCLDCTCYQPAEVRLCPVTACSLWPFRFGRNPNRAGVGGAS